MWNRAELKAKGKEAFKRNYWPSVLVALILGLIAGGSGGSAGGSSSSATMNNLQGSEDFVAIMLIVLAAIAMVLVIICLLDIFLFNPLKVGCYSFFLKNSDENADLNELSAGFKPNWLNVVITLFLRNLFLALWACLFLIPGIIKAYSYRLVPYILAENPDMKPMEAITLSRNMMNGHKMNTFILDLSFFGWGLLTVCTCGILGIFYVNPYYQATDAELYKAIKAGYAQQGNTVA